MGGPFQLSNTLSSDCTMGQQASWRPTNLFPTQALQTFALLLAALSLVRSKQQLLPPFVSEEEAAEVVKQRTRRVEHRLGRKIKLDAGGLKQQNRRVRFWALLSLAEVLIWSVWTSHNQEWRQGLVRVFTWSCVLIRVTLYTTSTPPFVLLVTLAVLWLISLGAAIDQIPHLMSCIGLSGLSLLLPLVDLAIISGQIYLILEMPMAAGGWEANVDEEERKRVTQATIIEEKEDIAENYEVSLSGR